MPVMRIFTALLLISFSWFRPASGYAGDELLINVSGISHDVRGGGKEYWAPSLQEANDLLHCLSGVYRRITVKVAEGVYRRQSFIWSYSRLNTDIFIVASGKVIMLGARDLTWMRVPISAGEPTNIHVQGFRLEGYKTAISFEGDRERLNGWNGNNFIVNNFFHDIGGSESTVSTAVLRFVNSRDNHVVGNEFVKINNKKSCALLHAVYLAHYSGNNIISNNIFRKGCGDPVRIRDASNGNYVTGNIFHDIGRAGLVTEWHCNPGESYTCTKINGHECLSFNNVVSLNSYQGNLPVKKILVSDDVCSSGEHR